MASHFISLIRDEPLRLLSIGLGAVFLAAGIQRILFFQLAVENFEWLGLRPAALLVITTIMIELAVGLCFITGKRLVVASGVLLALLSIGIGASLIKAGASFWNNANELFVLTATPTNIFLHLTYFFCIAVVLLATLKRKSE